MDPSSLAKLSTCLGEASELVNKLLTKETDAGASSSRPGSSRSPSDVSSALQRARSMLNFSTQSASGLTKRLNKRERLRATSTQGDQKKKAKKEDLKAFEFVLISIDDEDEHDWVISDDKIMLRGLIELSSDASEATIRSKIGQATRVNYPIVTDSDFVFLRATRRKLSIPVSCNSFGYKQLKVVAGQGAIYVKLKAGFECLLSEKKDSIDVDSDDGKR